MTESAKILSSLMLLAGILSAGAQQFLTNGLVVFLPLNAGAIDDSGNGRDGIAGATTPAPGIFGDPNGALAFDGQNSEIQIPVNYDFSQSGFTFSTMFLFDRAYSERAHQHYLMDGRQTDGGILYANVDADLIQALGTEVHPSLPLSPRRWYHLVATHDNASGETQIILNGILIQSTHTDSGVNFVRSITLGRRFSGSEHLTGRLSDVRIYDYALSAQDVSRLYAYESQAHNSGHPAKADDPYIVNGSLVNPATGVPVERPVVPTNSVLELSYATGDLRVLDSKGLVLETNFDYLPRIEISSLSTHDLAALLENQIAYQALTTFGPPKSTNSESAFIERHLENIWQKGKTLPEKLQTRLEILDEMRAYNFNAAWYAMSVGFVNRTTPQAVAVAGDMNDHVSKAMDYMSQAANAYVLDEHLIHAWAKSQEDAEIANAAAIAPKASELQRQVDSATGKASDYERACELHAAHLAKWRIWVSDTPPFYLIPSLSIKNGVDFERAELRE